MLRHKINFFERHCGLLLLVFLLPILTLALAFPSSQAQCGTVRAGSWTVAVSGEIQPGSGRSLESPEFTEGRIELVGECGEAFVLHGGGASFTFVRSDDANFGPLYVYYTYTSSTFFLRLNVENPGRMTGVSVSNAGVSRRFTLTYSGDTTHPPECDCPCLDEFLRERIEESRMWQTLYRNPTYWQRPRGWPPPPTREFEKDTAWNGNVYDRLINAMAKGQSYRDALAALDPRVERTVDLSQPQTEAEAGTRFAGGTNAETCEITLGNTHLDSGFPRIVRDQTLVHERVHEAVCKSMRSSLDLATYVTILFDDTEFRGLDEAAAYQADEDFISTWKSQNCN